MSGWPREVGEQVVSLDSKTGKWMALECIAHGATVVCVGDTKEEALADLEAKRPRFAEMNEARAEWQASPEYRAWIDGGGERPECSERLVKALSN